MNVRKTILLPKQAKIMAEMGENLKMARLRRKLTAGQVAERAGISRRTLVSVEKGSPSVAMGTYVQVLFVLGLADDLLNVAKDDLLGRKLQDAGLVSSRKRIKKNLTKHGC
jgi:transcriptional regulator with XRE-family HTH domain